MGATTKALLIVFGLIFIFFGMLAVFFISPFIGLLLYALFGLGTFLFVSVIIVKAIVSPWK